MRIEALDYRPPDPVSLDFPSCRRKRAKADPSNPKCLITMRTTVAVIIEADSAMWEDA
jgi:hypothetical protein